MEDKAAKTENAVKRMKAVKTIKIRTRIIMLSCIAIVAASLVWSVAIWTMVRKSLMKEAHAQAFQNSYQVASDLERMLESGRMDSGDTAYLKFYFKSRNDDYNICIRVKGMQTEEIYNHTVIDGETLKGMDYQQEDNKVNLQYDYFDWEGRHYIIFQKNMSGALVYYRIEDITYVYDRLKGLAAGMLAVTLGLALFTSLLLSIILKRALRPLQELNNTTKEMAKGHYGQRLSIRRWDEIGQLGESFNRMAEAVEERSRSLEESEKKKTLFMGDLTHELKTPMTAISGYAQTLLSTKLTADQQEEALLYIYEECGRLSRLSKKMMVLLELDQDTDLEFKDTKAADVFKAVGRACAAHAKEKQIVLKFSQQGESFLMDADLMTDALVNLTDNAIKASKKGGRVILRAYENCIEVQDFGKGIPADEQEKILEPFYMIDKSRSRKNGGAGLGLALTAMIARRHNVSLHIDSEVGKGTRMILQFV